MNCFKARSKYFFLIIIVSFLISIESSLFAQEEILAEGPNNVLISRVPDDLPLKIEIKNSDSANWVSDLEFEITNTGKKPIYTMAFDLALDGIRSESGNGVGFPLIYNPGEIRIVFDDAKKTLGDSFDNGDFSLDFNEIVILKVNSNNAQGWKIVKEQKNIKEPKKFILRFSVLSFGDGTGILTGEDKTGKIISVPRSPRIKN